MLAAQSSPVSGVVLTVTMLATSVALVAGLAWASRRLLGVPVGAVRALIAGLLGFVAAELLGRALRAAQPGHLAAFFTVALGVPLVVAMVFLVAAEVLVPTGTVPQPVEVIRETRRAVARSRRYSQISRIAVRHGLGPYLHGRRLRPADAADGRTALAQSLRQALEEGGVTFTKLGQLLSTRRDLLPQEFISELAQLQDRAEPAQWEQIQEAIARSLGEPAGQVFAELQPEPAAAASIAQVHKVSPRAVQKTVADELLALLPVLRRLPRRFDRITTAMEQGRFGLNVRLFADERDRREVTGLTNQVLLTFLGAITGVVAALQLGISGAPKIASDVSLYQLIGYNLLIVASILVLRVLFTIFRSR